MLSQWELNLELSFSPKEDNIDCSSINFSQLCALYQKRISPFINFCQNRGISRDSWHKRRATGGRRKPIRMKRKFELGRPPAMTKIMGPKRIHTVRTMGYVIRNRFFLYLSLSLSFFSPLAMINHLKKLFYFHD